MARFFSYCKCLTRFPNDNSSYQGATPCSLYEACTHYSPGRFVICIFFLLHLIKIWHNIEKMMENPKSICSIFFFMCKGGSQPFQNGRHFGSLYTIAGSPWARRAHRASSPDPSWEVNFLQETLLNNSLHVTMENIGMDPAFPPFSKMAAIRSYFHL